MGGQSPRSPQQRIGALIAAIAIALGAFGAHGLRGSLGDTTDAVYRLGLWETASRYLLIHGAAIAALPSLSKLTARLFGIGLIVFCGTLFGIALGGPLSLGAITPLGGASLIGAWITFALPWQRLAK